MALKPAAARDRALPTRALGRGGRDVTVVGFGAAPLGDLYARLDDAHMCVRFARAGDFEADLSGAMERSESSRFAHGADSDAG
jgi:hypothetical protein